MAKANTSAKTPAATPAPTSPPEGLVSLIAVEPIRHNGIDVQPGASFAADAAAAQALLDSGAATLAGAQ